jgi:hypothetical protein
LAKIPNIKPLDYLAVHRCELRRDIQYTLDFGIAAVLEQTLADTTDMTLLAPPKDAIPLESKQLLLQSGNEEILSAVVTPLSYSIMLLCQYPAFSWSAQ